MRSPPRHPGRPSGTAFWPGGRLAALITVVVLLVAGTAGALLLRGRDGSASFAATDEVPLTFTYPRAWGRHLHSGQFAVLSPHNLNNFFSDLEDPWAGVRSWLADDQKTVVGVYLPFRTRTLEVGSDQAVDTALEGLLTDVPGKRRLTILDHRPVRVGGHPADRVPGRMEDPGDPATSLAFVDYVIEVKPGKAVHLLLFGPDERALEAAEFDRLVRSVRVDAAHVR
jgi:hypothetical protein